MDWIFRTTGNYGLIGSARRTAAGYAHWFSDHGHYTADLSQRARGDLIFYHEPGKGIAHVAIYLQAGNIISALVNPWGVSQTNWKRITATPVGIGKVQYPGATATAFADRAPGAATDPDAGQTFVQQVA